MAYEFTPGSERRAGPLIWINSPASDEALPIRRRPKLEAAIAHFLGVTRPSKPFYAMPMSSADWAYSAALVGFAMMVRSARS